MAGRGLRRSRLGVIKFAGLAALLALFVALAAGTGRGAFAERSLSSPGRRALRGVAAGAARDDDDEIVCEDVFDQDDSCEFAREYCDGEGTFNYLEVFFCHLEEPLDIVGSMFVFGVLVMLLFYILGRTADEYFCPALTRMGTMARMSDDTVGVTLLALGSGIPDIFSVFSGVSSDDLDIALGGIMGAAMFVVVVVFGTTSLVSDLTVDKLPFLRDLLMYFVAVALLFGISLSGVVYLWQPFIFIALYVFYVFLVVGRNYSRGSNGGGGADADEDPSLADIPAAEREAIERQAKMHVPTPDLGFLNAEVRRHGRSINQPAEEVDYDETAPLLDAVRAVSSAGTSVGVRDIEDDSDSDDDCEVAWSELPPLQKVFFAILLPIDLLLDYSVPPVKLRTATQKRRLCASPFLGLLVIYFALFDDEPEKIPGTDVPMVVLFVAAGALLSALVSVLVWTSLGECVPARLHNALPAACFVVSIVWIYVTAGEVVSLLQAMGVLFGVGNAILGITVLAWGNSIGDFVSNVSVARQGFPRMAVAACYASPLFNLAVGLSVTFLITIGGGPPLRFTLAPTNMVAFAGVLVGMLLTAVGMILARYRCPKSLGGALLAFYAVALSTSIVVEIQDL